MVDGDRRLVEVDLDLSRSEACTASVVTGALVLELVDGVTVDDVAWMTSDPP